MSTDQGIAGGFESLLELPIAPGRHEERPVLGADPGAERYELAHERNEHRHWVVMIGIGNRAPRPGAQQGVAGIDRAQKVHWRPLVRDNTGLQVLVGGRVMAGQVVDVLRPERDKCVESGQRHVGAQRFQPPRVFVHAEGQRLNQRPGSFCNLH